MYLSSEGENLASLGFRIAVLVSFILLNLILKGSDIPMLGLASAPTYVGKLSRHLRTSCVQYMQDGRHSAVGHPFWIMARSYILNSSTVPYGCIAGRVSPVVRIHSRLRCRRDRLLISTTDRSRFRSLLLIALIASEDFITPAPFLS